MRNFFQFIWNNQFTFLFFLLEFIGFALLTSSNSFHQSKLASTSVAVSGKLADINHTYAQYIGLKDENEKLLEENARLRAKSTSHNENGTVIDYDVTSAQVINSTYHLGNNYMILNKGSAEGIKTQQGVIGSNGIVGIVHKVSEHYCAVMPLIHSQSLVSCKLGESGYFGILKWDGKNDQFAILEDIPNHVGVIDGTSIYTRGASGAFPPDQMVGRAVASNRNESSGFQQIKVELATDFRSISNVYVLSNEVKPELDSLMNEIIE